MANRPTSNEYATVGCAASVGQSGASRENSNAGVPGIDGNECTGFEGGPVFVEHSENDVSNRDGHDVWRANVGQAQAMIVGSEACASPPRSRRVQKLHPSPAKGSYR
jgi:hypothetical protein